ncbi:MAG: hypothetical protein ACHQJ4_01770 [Ignavibacteria bacterium]
MKKFISIFLLNLMFYNILGYYFAYRFMIQDVKEEMKFLISENRESNHETLIKLPYSSGKITDTNFVYQDESEFIYKGDLYDIARSEIQGDYIYFYCINDTKEEAISTQLNRQIQENLAFSQFPSKKSEGSEKEFIKEYLPYKMISLILPPISEINFFFPQEKTLTLKLDIDTPPPEDI